MKEAVTMKLAVHVLETTGRGRACTLYDLSACVRATPTPLLAGVCGA